MGKSLHAAQATSPAERPTGRANQRYSVVAKPQAGISSGSINSRAAIFPRETMLLRPALCALARGRRAGGIAWCSLPFLNNRQSGSKEEIGNAREDSFIQCLDGGPLRAIHVDFVIYAAGQFPTTGTAIRLVAEIFQP